MGQDRKHMLHVDVYDLLTSTGAFLTSDLMAHVVLLWYQ